MCVDALYGYGDNGAAIC